MNILIFGGTTEGRILARELSSKHQITISVATAFGAEEVKDLEGVDVLCGRLDASGMKPLLSKVDLCVDATHPYADQVSREIRSACEDTGVTLKRLLRPASQTGGCLEVSDYQSAADLLMKETGNILIATGAKELSAFSNLDHERLYVRILPVHASLDACEALGLPHSHIIAMQGPFSCKLNRAIFEQFKINWLVTKDGGDAGGFAEKKQAADEVGTRLILIRRPADDGETLNEILKQLEGKM